MTMEQLTKKCPKPIVIPIVFVPGIMGSRLRQTDNPDIIAWDPPTQNSGGAGDRSRATDLNIEVDDYPEKEIGRYWNEDIDYDGDTLTENEEIARDAFTYNEAKRSGIHLTDQLYIWGNLNDKERRQLVIGDSGDPFSSNFLEVDPGDREHFEGRISENLIDEKIDRGWGGVAWTFYGGFLRWLDQHLLRELPHFPVGCTNINFEIWAHPYNWTDDNLNAAKGLKTLVQKAHSEARAKYKDTPETKVIKPIVITHSMGGLVGRACSKLAGGQELIHTMIHGAMPTHGSPASYKRMRSGFWGVQQVMMGWDDKEVCALMANSPGALQLLPNQFHKDVKGNSEWLKVTYRSEGDILSLPKNKDPYKEVYGKRTDWWRLVNPSHIDPEDKDDNESWKQYLSYLTLAKSFHKKLGEKGFHSPTNMFYCASDQGGLCWDKVEWKLENRYTLSRKEKQRAKVSMTDTKLPGIDNGSGDLKFDLREDQSRLSDEKKVWAKVAIQHATAAGDGTVHTGSGEYVPELELGLESSATEDVNGDFDIYEHSEAFNSRLARAQVANWISEIIVEESKS